jgi:hypothetical protein
MSLRHCKPTPLQPVAGSPGIADFIIDAGLPTSLHVLTSRRWAVHPNRQYLGCVR